MKHHGIERQTLLVALIPVLILAVLMESFFIFERCVDLDRALLERAQLMVHQLASNSEYSVFSGNTALLTQNINSVLAQQDVSKVAVLDADAKLLLGGGIKPGAAAVLSKKVNLQAPIYQDAEVLLLYEPILATQVSVDEIGQASDAGKPLGAVIIEISKQRLSKQKNQIIFFSLLATLMVLMVTLMVALWAARRITKPIMEIYQAVRRIGEGALDTNISPQNNIYELNELAYGINRMTQDLHYDRSMLEDCIAEVTKGLREKIIEVEQASIEKKSLNEKLALALEELKSIMEANPDILYVFNLKGELIQWNSSFEKFCGLTSEQMMNKPATEFVSAEDRQALIKGVMEVFEKGSVTMEVHFVRHDGVPVFYLCNGVVLKNTNGEVIGFTGTGRDISERKAAAEHMRRMAHYDALTELPNRTLLSDRLQQALATARRDKARLALMFLDLDMFKPINDTLGHYIGDLLLKEVAKRIQDCLRETDTAARIGGDEFVVLLPVIESEQDAMGVAEKIRYALCQPIELAGHTLHISSSIGVAVYPEHGSEERALLKSADNAMYLAKAAGRNIVKLFQEGIQESRE